MVKSDDNGFFVLTREPGTERHDIPLWASEIQNPFGLTDSPRTKVTRQDLPKVPGSFQLLDLLSTQECTSIVRAVEAMGFNKDAAVSLPRSQRHNDSVTWIADETTLALIWDRCKHLMTDTQGIHDGSLPLGINGRFRFYRYQPGDFFKPHIDGSWPGSRVVNGELIRNAYPDRWSRMTFLILLSEDFVGGETQFLLSQSDSKHPARPGEPADAINVRTPTGGVLCFPHGRHPLHCLHASMPIKTGTKYIIRTDVLYPV